MTEETFRSLFCALTGNRHFPWQWALYQKFAEGNFPPSCDLPTGLGKTSVIALWLIALAHHPDRLPRRLVYVVNRRTVVDQTTTEVEKLRTNLRAAGLFDPLKQLCAIRLEEDEPPLAVSTLRGQFADNREWSADPCRPAVICGTVDMIGSRLLFSGYGVGFKGKPLHAGFLGQDVLLVHDEAHLEPAFQRLIETIRGEQDRCKDFRPLHVMALTATSRNSGEVFDLTGEDKAHPVVKERINARKILHLHPLDNPKKKLADQLAAQAKEFEDKNRAVLVFARTVDDVLNIECTLPKDRVVTLTGTMRGKERDALVEHPLFKRFLPGGQSDEQTTYLVCTSAGEVGVNISADHLVCDLTPFDSMAQRFGRVNRFGQRFDTEIHVFHPKKEDFKNDDNYDQARAKTLELLRKLNGDACPDALGRLDPAERQAAFTPEPTILPTTDILFDAWALTTIRDKLPGRPPVEPYLHGIAEWQPPETYVAWREEVGRITGDLLNEYKPADLLDAYPLKPHELLRDQSTRVFDCLKKRQAPAETPVWLLEDGGGVQVTTLGALIEAGKEAIEYKTVLLPPSVGGLRDGLLTADSSEADDVADTAERVRVWSDDERYDDKTADMHCVRRIAFPSGEDEDAEEKLWEWFTRINQGDPSAKKPVLWDVHVGDVERIAAEIVDRLPLSKDIQFAMKFAAKYHDHGKKRKQFQRMLGNTNPNVWLAKSGKKGGRMAETYRHEFGSLLDVGNGPGFQALNDDMKDLVLHLIAAHHGRGRPHFPPDEAFDPERPQADAERLAAEAPRRFARLQRKYGRWGLAYLESLLRAADWAASNKPSSFWEPDNE
jgi:CRISPR-associated endonuclease/helicase Cas3